MGIDILTSILIIFSLSIVILYIFNRMRVPTIVGFLICGILVGPHGFAFIGESHEVEVLAEIGVALLLFTIGIELSFAKLLKIRKSVLLGGSAQVGLTILASYLIASELGLDTGKSIFIGFLISLSSTAIVLKLIQDRNEVETQYGQSTLGILIFQDIIIVPMILATPILAQSEGVDPVSFIYLALKIIGVLILVVLGARYIVPRVLYQIARTRNRELFLLSIFVICLGVAWATSSAGFSLSIGAFLAGLIISESEYSHEALGNVLPFRDVFTSFFFISIGMLLNIEFVFDGPGLILLITAGVLLLKTFIATLAAFILGLPLRISILVGLALCQVGEFSFILSETGIEYGLLDEYSYQMFLSVCLLSMLATPFMILLAPRVADKILTLPIPERVRSGFSPVMSSDTVTMQDHLIIAGFGLNGRNLARAAKVAGIPYVIIEMNPDTVRSERAKGEPIFYGDASREVILKHANMESARVLVSVINDPIANRRIITLARNLNPDAYLISRTRFVNEVRPLYSLGANEVIPEEFETSIEIFTLVLEKYLIPRDNIEGLVTEVRSDGYKLFRNAPSEVSASGIQKLRLTDIKISTLSIKEQSPIAGKSLAQIMLRRDYGVLVLAIRRNSEVISNPDSRMELSEGDELYVLGKPDEISEVDRNIINPTKDS